MPARVDVRALQPRAGVGSSAGFEIRLKDPANREAKAYKPMAFQVEARSPSGRRSTQTLTIPQGASSARGQVKVLEPGPLSIRTSQAELPQGGTYILGVAVRPARSRASSSGTGSTTPALRLRSGGTFANPATEPLAAAPAPNPAANEAAPGRLWIGLSVDRPIRAGGDEALDVTVYLLDVEPEQAPEVEIHMHPSLGRLEPNPIVMPAGSGVVTAKLYSDKSGEGALRFLSSKPAFALDGEPDFPVKFGPPIWGMTLQASPPDISIVEKTSIVAELVDKDGIPTATDKDLRMTLRVKQGDGRVMPLEIDFAAGQSTGQAVFQPTDFGTTVISGSMPELLTQDTSIATSFPWLALALTLVGGSIGGLLAYLTAKERWWRIPIGTASGVIIYWAAVFGFIDQVPEVIAQNVFSALILAAIGGYIGIGIIKFVGKLGGINA